MQSSARIRTCIGRVLRRKLLNTAGTIYTLRLAQLERIAERGDSAAMGAVTRRTALELQFAESLDAPRSSADDAMPLDVGILVHPFASLRLRPRAALAAFDFAFISRTSKSYELARALCVFAASHRASSVIAGKVGQHDMARHKLWRDKLTQTWLEIVHAVRNTVELPDTSPHLVAPKLLASEPRQGAQPLHWDSKFGSNVVGRWSLILYCTDGDSTAMPVYARDQLRTHGVTKAQMLATSHLLHESSYRSTPVLAGDIIVFHQRVAHHGVRNVHATSARIVLFDMLSSQSFAEKSDQDDYQHFHHMHVGRMHGLDSGEYAAALLASAKMMDPLSCHELEEQLRMKRGVTAIVRKLEALVRNVA